MTDIPPHQCLLIIDFGSQVTRLIARRLRELNVYCEIHPCQNVTMDFVRRLAPRAVILSGGPDSVTRQGSPRAPQGIFGLGVPVLGICYGQQVMMEQLGGRVESAPRQRRVRARPCDARRGDSADPRRLVRGRPGTGVDVPWRSCQPGRTGV